MQGLPAGRAVDPSGVVQQESTIDDGSSALLFHSRGADSEAGETRTLARITLGRVEWKSGSVASRRKTGQQSATIALLHRLLPLSATRELRERLTLFCTWVV